MKNVLYVAVKVALFFVISLVVCALCNLFIWDNSNIFLSAIGLTIGWCLYHTIKFGVTSVLSKK